MLRISQIKIPVQEKQTVLEAQICRILRLPPEKLLSWEISRRSIEARRGERLSYVYSVDAAVRNEDQVWKKSKHNNIMLINKPQYQIPYCGRKESGGAPVIIGSGPAGLFCALLLAERGYCPVVLERGEAVEERRKSVEQFWAGGALNEESNVQFGEGGAGTFSDGKLNTGIKDKDGRIAFVLKTFAEYGAPREILFDAKPHVGTDILYEVVRNLRERIRALGGRFYYSAKVTDLDCKDGRLQAVHLQNGERMDCGVCVAAIGHSARDTILMLQQKGVQMEPRAFAVGVRIQHPQELINRSQWGEDYPKTLGAAPYSLSERAPDGRGVYTFCMCPGGYIVNASSEKGRLAVNGMSYSGRGSGYANSALIAAVQPSDFLSCTMGNPPIRGTKENFHTSSFCIETAGADIGGIQPEVRHAIAFQRMLEANAWHAAAGAIPVQRFEDFRAGRVSQAAGLDPCTKGAWDWADVRGIFPGFLAEDLAYGISAMGKKLRGFDLPDAVLAGVESRTSSPVRIYRDDAYQSSIRGLYPCGEGAGYAGGIVSAAVDGMKVAEEIIRTFRPVP